MMADAALECRDVSVHFGDVAALVGVTCAFAPRMIHAIVGQNGAGKTTFARVAAGIVPPATGILRVGGHNVPTGKVNLARLAGVELVHQSFALPPSFTVAEAMEFGAHARSPVYSRKGLEARWEPHLKKLGIQVGLSDRIRDLPVEVQQGVEIARALVADAKVLILDEPTAVLAPAGISRLFDRLKALAQSGVTIILILHKIREVLGIADTITVFRNGRLVEGPIAATSTDGKQLAALIIGSSADDALSAEDQVALVGDSEEPASAVEKATERASTSSALEIADVSTQPDLEGPALEGASLTIGRGEIIGVAGVEGNGQRTLVRVLSRLASLTGGTIALGGKDVTDMSLSARRANGLRIIPFDRNREGLSLSSSLWENWSARLLLLGNSLRLVDPSRLREACNDSLRKWGVRFSVTTQPAGSLSGGNAQKVILAREIDADALVIVAAQPTRGLDIGATAFVWQSLREARARGCGVLLVSSDLDELFDISDRIIVMLSGRIVGEFHPPYRLGKIGAAMIGAGR